MNKLDVSKHKQRNLRTELDCRLLLISFQWDFKEIKNIFQEILKKKKPTHGLHPPMTWFHVQMVGSVKRQCKHEVIPLKSCVLLNSHTKY